MARISALLLLVSFPVFSVESQGRPAILRIVDAKTGRETGRLSDAQVDGIVRFVKTVPGVDHRVQEVDGTEPPQIIAHTGASRGTHGDLLRIGRRHGCWVLVSKGKWKLDETG